MSDTSFAESAGPWWPWSLGSFSDTWPSCRWARSAGRGHPALPAAPAAVYVLLYLVILPALCAFAAWKGVTAIERRQRRR